MNKFLKVGIEAATLKGLENITYAEIHNRKK